MPGVWIEQDENGVAVKVVTSQPARGIQLAGDGQEVTPDMQARIDAAKADLSGDSVRGGSDSSDGGGSVITSEGSKTRTTRK